MEHIESKPKGLAWRWLGAGIGPFVLLSAYCFFSRWPSRMFNASADYAGVVVSVLVGVAFVATLPLRTYVRVLSILRYIPVLFAVLFFYGLVFVLLIFKEYY